MEVSVHSLIQFQFKINKLIIAEASLTLLASHHSTVKLHLHLNLIQQGQNRFKFILVPLLRLELTILH